MVDGFVDSVSELGILMTHQELDGHRIQRVDTRDETVEVDAAVIRQGVSERCYVARSKARKLID
jgi:hypothetical protein